MAVNYGREKVSPPHANMDNFYQKPGFRNATPPKMAGMPSPAAAAALGKARAAGVAASKASRATKFG